MTPSRLADAGLTLSPLALGCELLGGTDWGDVDLAEARKAVERALELGITVFDTADVYGLGRSEKELSRALGPRRHDVVIVTKGGVRWERGSSAGTRAPTSFDSSPGYLRGALEASLHRLRVEAIPLYLVHWPDPHTPLEATLDELERAREAGKILSYGLSNFRCETISKWVARVPCAAVQCSYSLIDRVETEAAFAEARRHRVATLAYGALAQGLLTGAYDRTTEFDETDRRHQMPHFSKAAWTRNERLLRALREVAASYGRSVAQVALQWVLGSALVDTVVVGARRPGQVEANVASLGWALVPEHRQLLDDCAVAWTVQESDEGTKRSAPAQEHRA